MGFPNARYKGFKTKAEAEAFLNPDANELMQIDEDTLVAYVDGSYDHSQKRFSYGMVLMHDGVERYFAYPYADKELATMRNVAGEVLGSMAAIEKALELGLKDLTRPCVLQKKMAIKSWRFIMIMKGSRNGAQENGQRKKKEHRRINEFMKK